MRFFRLWDCKEIDGPKGMIEVPESDLELWNKRKWGIFHCVNQFHGEQRRKEFLTKIDYYYADIDNFRKERQWETIQSGLKPTIVNETKKGFQCYWAVSDGSIKNWALIMERIREYYSADPNAKDPLRVLRTPGFYHWKDHNNPFLVRQVYKSEAIYTESTLLMFFPASEKEQFRETPEAREIRWHGEDLFDRIYNLDCEDALTRLSGSKYVGGEHYTFRRTGSGNKNIYVEGKSTSCWIDKDGRIGSFDKGGPTVWQWLKWFGNTNKEISEIMREVFPEVFNGLDDQR